MQRTVVAVMSRVIPCEIKGFTEQGMTLDSAVATAPDHLARNRQRGDAGAGFGRNKK